MTIRTYTVVLVALVAVLTGPALFAYDANCNGCIGDEWDLTEEQMLPYNAAIGEFLADNESATLDELTIGDLRELGAELSVIAQEEDYVRRARQSSRFIPGAGHFMIGEGGRGAAFVTGSVLITAGTLVGAYFVLPDGVQFGEVDYINDSFREIGTAWRAESFASILPAVGVLIGGGILNAILGEIASEDAEKRARLQIQTGERTFEPQPFIFPDANGRLMLGARIGF